MGWSRIDLLILLVAMLWAPSLSDLIISKVDRRVCSLSLDSFDSSFGGNAYIFLIICFF